MAPFFLVDRRADSSSRLSWSFSGERRSRSRSRRAWRGSSRRRSSSRSDHTAPKPGWPAHRGRATPRPTPLRGPSSRRSRPHVGSGVTYRLRPPVHTDRRSPGRAGGLARDPLDPTGRDAAELVVTVEKGRTYFEIAAFETEGAVLLPFRVHVTSPGALGSHPLEALPPVAAGRAPRSNSTPSSTPQLPCRRPSGVVGAPPASALPRRIPTWPRRRACTKPPCCCPCWSAWSTSWKRTRSQSRRPCLSPPRVPITRPGAGGRRQLTTAYLVCTERRISAHSRAAAEAPSEEADHPVLRCSDVAAEVSRHRLTPGGARPSTARKGIPCRPSARWAGCVRA